MDSLYDSDLSFAGAVGPLVIGVTGHRDLREEDRGALATAVRGVFADLRRKYVHTPVILVSALAEGADRLVAELALEAHIPIAAVLPLPPQLYEEDFSTSESIAEFRRQLAGAQFSFSVPLAAAESEVARPGNSRDAQYEKAGTYIVQQCQILLALWDGEENEKTGGTAQIVRYQLEGLNLGKCRLDPLEPFPVFHISTPRSTNAPPKFPPFQLRKLYGLRLVPESTGADAKAFEAAGNYYDRVFRNLDEYNRDAAQASRATPPEATIDDERAVAMPSARTALARYAIVDTIAIDFQRRTIRLQIALHWMIYCAFLCFVLFAHWPEEWRLDKTRMSFLVISGVLLLASFLVRKYGADQRVDSKYLDYRALAEGLRVKFFWQVAGIRESIASHYLGKQRTELDWIRIGFRGWDLGEAVPAISNRESIEVAKTKWAQRQFEYFDRKAEQNERSAKRYESWIVTFVWVAILGLLACFITWNCGLWSNVNIVLVDAFLAAGALLHHYSNQMAFVQHQKQYTRMRSVFRSACDGLDKVMNDDAGDLLEAKDCIFKLGCEALAENGDWVLLHRERPLELPHV
jgi:hypothetical protein